MAGRLRQAGLLLGPLAALIVHASLPAEYAGAGGELLPLSPAARGAAAVGAWMAVWWLSEAIPVYVTALLPLAAFPLLGVSSIEQTALSYGHKLIYLFLGGFIVALALERWGVHRRLALAVLGMVGTRPGRIVAAFMAVSAGLSMWVTNTATTIMLLPVALSVLRLATAKAGAAAESGQSQLGHCLLLGIAYAASIGGLGTIVGTAPNLFLVSFIESRMGVEIGFLDWMLVGVPVVLLFLPCCWWLLVRRIFPLPRTSIAGMQAAIAELAAAQQPMSSGERRTLLVFLLTALAWITRPLLADVSLGGWRPLAGLSDAGIAIIAAIGLFILPAGGRPRRALMDWETAVRLPWGLLVLFGGGLTLAAALDDSGFSRYLGTQAAALGSLPPILIVLAVTSMVIFLTEITSNTATTATLVPLLYAVALGLQLDPLLLIVPAGLAASCAFMLPVATPPNAIVFGSGQVGIAAMSRAGLRLNLVGIVLITAMAYAVAIPMLGRL
ncbi:MAG: DASS family sodium-coupled anion symporter [Gammaproteobacteria bacterium]|nr:MAG: DASS family sodium-coupled anion symporter [Gammaproteobacteria bacterium]